MAASAWARAVQLDALSGGSHRALGDVRQTPRKPAKSPFGDLRGLRGFAGLDVLEMAAVSLGTVIGVDKLLTSAHGRMPDAGTILDQNARLAGHADFRPLKP